jgi:hypothetical protein
LRSASGGNEKVEGSYIVLLAKLTGEFETDKRTHAVTEEGKRLIKVREESFYQGMN